MDEIKDIFFDAADVLSGLRKETKAWALTFKNSADAIRGMLGTVKTTIRTEEKRAKRTIAEFDQIHRLQGKDVTVTKTVTTQEGALDTLQKVAGDVIGEVKWVISTVLKTVQGLLGGKLSEVPKWNFGDALRDLGGIFSKVSAVQALLRGDTTMATWFGLMDNSITSAGDKLSTLCGVISTISMAFTGMGAKAGQAWQGVTALFGTAATWFTGNVIAPMNSGTQGAVNAFVALINGAMKGVSSAFNAVSKFLNRIFIKVPEWVPVLGGKTFGFKLPAFTAPAIPMLAQGAVLPANKPFLAMVGDQKHGTNIEAPLSTIQEAVAMVLDDQIGAITAGFEASVGVQREILEAVLGIRIGDELIANAGDRYRQKMAVARGGVL